MMESQVATRPDNLPAQQGSTQLRPTLNSVPEEVREGVAGLLNQLLADTADLHSQIKQAHWNVRGPHFQPLHELFDEVAGILPEYVDQLAERIGSLGGVAKGTARSAAANSRLPEIDLGLLNGSEAVKAVAHRLAQVTNAMRAGVDQTDAAGDAITADLLTGMTGELDKQLWFVESHLDV